MSLEFLTQFYIPSAVAGGIVVGYVMKKWLPADNKWIPTILPIVGIIVACLANHSLSILTIIAGAVSGLASVGMHQAVTQHIDKGDVNFDTEDFDDEDDEDDDDDDDNYVDFIEENY